MRAVAGGYHGDGSEAAFTNTQTRSAAHILELDEVPDLGEWCCESRWIAGGSCQLDGVEFNRGTRLYPG
jgi:hypothetical protein